MRRALQRSAWKMIVKRSVKITLIAIAMSAALCSAATPAFAATAQLQATASLQNSASEIRLVSGQTYDFYVSIPGATKSDISKLAVQTSDSKVATVQCVGFDPIKGFQMRVTAALSGTPNETLPTGEATTRIQVNYQGQSTSCTVVVSPKSALSLSTSEVKMMGKAGGTTYDFYVLGINDVSKLKVSSRNSSVATVQLVDAKDPRGAKYRITAQPNKNPAEMGAMGTQITYIDVEYNGAKKNISVLNFLTAGSLMLDTTQYTMPTTGGTYQIGLTITDSKGNKLAGSEIQELLDAGRLKVSDSRSGSIVDLQPMENGNFRVTAKKPGTTYIQFQYYNADGSKAMARASTRIDVKDGAAPQGSSTRDTTYWSFDQDTMPLHVTVPQHYYPKADGTYDEQAILKDMVSMGQQYGMKYDPSFYAKSLRTASASLLAGSSTRAVTGLYSDADLAAFRLQQLCASQIQQAATKNRYRTGSTEGIAFNPQFSVNADGSLDMDLNNNDNGTPTPGTGGTVPTQPETKPEEKPSRPSSSKKTVISRVESVENGKVRVTFNRPLTQPLTLDDISILCTGGGSDMTILDIKTTDNRVFDLTTSYFFDNTYEFYVTLPNGQILSKEFVVKTDCPTISATKMVRLNDGVAEFRFASDTSGKFYYLLEEAPAARFLRSADEADSVPTVEEVKENGVAVDMSSNGNQVRISGLKKDTAYNLYYVAEDREGKFTDVKGPVSIDAQPPVQPESSKITVESVTPGKSGNDFFDPIYFDIVLSEATAEPLTLENFSISCPAESMIHLGKVETTDNKNYRVSMEPGYVPKSGNHMDLTITFPDDTIATHTFFLDLEAPKITQPKVERKSDTSADFTFTSNEQGTIYYIVSDLPENELDNKPTVKEVVDTGEQTTMQEGGNLISLKNVQASSKSVFFVVEDNAGNQQLFVDSVKIPADAVQPEAPSSVSITNITGNIDTGNPNKPHVITAEFDQEITIPAKSNIKITGNGTNITDRDIWQMSPAVGFSGNQLELTLTKALSAGSYTLTLKLDDGETSASFTVNDDTDKTITFN